MDSLFAPLFDRPSWLVSLGILAVGALLCLFFALRLRQLNARLSSRMSERMAEQERVARELHDALLQSMQGLVMRFQTAAERIPAGDPARQMLEEALAESDQVLTEGRERAHGLRTTGAGANDLADAYAAVALELKQDYPADFRLVVNGEARELHPTVRDELYRIGREAITNSFQHADSRRYETELHYDRSELRICFRDEGRGVDKQALVASDQSGHWGVSGMQERARKIGAELEVWSRPGGGTEVVVRVPAAIAYRTTAHPSPWQWLRRKSGGES
jgi:signal transduction histidine kinase